MSALPTTSKWLVNNTCEATNVSNVEWHFVFYSNIDYEELFVLNSRVNELQYELEILQLLQNYGIEKDVQTLHTNKANVQFQKNILTEMVHAKVDR